MQVTVSRFCGRHAKDSLRSLPLTLVLFLLPVSGPRAWGQVYSWSTIAGSTNAGSADGTNSGAGFYEPCRSSCGRGGQYLRDG